MCYIQCHMFGLFIVMHSSPLPVLAGVPVLWFRCPLQLGKREAVRSVGPWLGGEKSRGSGETVQTHCCPEGWVCFGMLLFIMLFWTLPVQNVGTVSLN